MIFLEILICLIFVGIIIYQNKKYKETTYYKITKNPYLSVYFDKGKLGEYDIYRYLKRFENEGAQFLFNAYIPKEDGNTTEIDVLMIYPKGILVFESKNYSGWIFGSENQKTWTQVLPKGKGRSQKEYFINPVIQNRGHIRHLKNIVGQDIEMKSIIVFSNRCTLKDINLKSADIKVINRYEIVGLVSDILNQVNQEYLDAERIKSLYEKIYPFTQLNEAAKAQHIQNIRAMSDLNAERTVKSTQIAANESKINITSKDIPVNLTEQQKQANSNIVCPKCGGQLVLRTAKKGQYAGKQFWGCVNYPKCKYVQNL